MRSAGEDVHALRHLDMQLRREAVGLVASGGEPARGIEQVGDGLLDGGELEAFDRAVFVARDDALVFEGPVGGLSGGEGLGRRDADGAVGEPFSGEQFARFVGDLDDLECGMEAEADFVGAFRRSEGDLGLRGDVVRRRIELSIDDVAGDVECGAIGALGRGRAGGEQGGENQEGAAEQAPDKERGNHREREDHWLSERHIVFSQVERFRRYSARHLRFRMARIR